MRETSKFALPLWDAADRILREDFNRLSEKAESGLSTLDTALATLSAAMPYVKLDDMTVNAETTQVNMNVSGMNLTQYRRLELEVNHLPLNRRLYLRVNSLTANYRASGPNFNARSQGELESLGGTALFQFSRPRSQEKVGAYTATWSGDGSGSSYSVAPITWGELRTLNFCSQGGVEKIPVGVRFQLFGVR